MCQEPQVGRGSDTDNGPNLKSLRRISSGSLGDLRVWRGQAGAKGRE
jgi:hypothetical protein